MEGAAPVPKLYSKIDSQSILMEGVETAAGRGRRGGVEKESGVGEEGGVEKEEEREGERMEEKTLGEEEEGEQSEEEEGGGKIKGGRGG